MFRIGGRTVFEWQIRRIKELFPGVGDPDRDLLYWIGHNLNDLPKGAEGWFAVPNWRKYPEIFGVRYDDAAEKALLALKDVLGGAFITDIKYLAAKWEAKAVPAWKQLLLRLHPLRLPFQYLREGKLKEALMLEIIAKQKNSGILLFPAQFGLAHAGEATDRVMSDVKRKKEFCLGAFENAVMLSLCSERLGSKDDLFLDCGGDELYLGSHIDSFIREVYFARRDDATVDLSWKAAVEGSEARAYSGASTLFFDDPEAVFNRCFEMIKQQYWK